MSFSKINENHSIIIVQRYGKPQLSGKSGKYCRLKEAEKIDHFLFNKGIYFDKNFCS